MKLHLWTFIYEGYPHSTCAACSITGANVDCYCVAEQPTTYSLSSAVAGGGASIHDVILFGP